MHLPVCLGGNIQSTQTFFPTNVSIESHSPHLEIGLAVQKTILPTPPNSILMMTIMMMLMMRFLPNPCPLTVARQRLFHCFRENSCHYLSWINLQNVRWRFDFQSGTEFESRHRYFKIHHYKTFDSYPRSRLQTHLLVFIPRTLCQDPKLQT